jgi:hypothetical protein
MAFPPGAGLGDAKSETMPFQLDFRYYVSIPAIIYNYIRLSRAERLAAKGVDAILGPFRIYFGPLPA